MEIVLRLLWAFLLGGALCVVAQILIDKTKLTPARILVSSPSGHSVKVL